MATHPYRLLCGLPLALVLACSASNGSGVGQEDGGRLPDGGRGPRNGDAGPGPQAGDDAGTKLENVPVNAADQAAFAALAQKADGAGALDLTAAKAAYPAQFITQLGYDPTQAAQLDLIQASAMSLSDAETGVLAKNGFVISTRHEFPTFLRGLAELYSEHLPVYVSADALMEAVHRSYDGILTDVERSMIIPELHTLLQNMRTRLPTLQVAASVRADLDLYLAVALSLLDGNAATAVAGASNSQIQDLTTQATAASGTGVLTLFGVDRTEDWSQFTPRGHYASDTTLSQYFRAQMWLGRIDFRLLETQSDGSQLFHRNQYLATLAMYTLVTPDMAHFEHIDDAIRTFVGESDYMVLSQVKQLVADLGGDAAAVTASDAAVAAAIVNGGYGQQEIASYIQPVNLDPSKPLPLNRSFALLGQRYIVDSQVFSETVFDRVESRLMPNPLDVAFAVLANNQALGVDGDASTYPDLPGALARQRVLVDSHDQSFWDANLYNLWLGALRGLSPVADLANAAPTGLPALMRSEPWGRRIINAQLGSWAELRHDTLLYAKQSYTGTPGCAFPDAFVDPYPDFYRALNKYALAGQQVATIAAQVSPDLAANITKYFQTLADATSKLGAMAEQELRGEPYTDDQLAFINDAVRVETQSVVCSTIEVPDGWYATLFYDPAKSIEADPTIADVHTQPADEAGNPVGKILHVGTGDPRLMVATVDTCMGPRAYAGIVYAYHEQITDNFKRLTDEEWALNFGADLSMRPADVTWLSDVLAK